jgi:GGDEF domain-containing protein
MAIIGLYSNTMKRGPLLIAIVSLLLVAAMAAWPVLRIAQAIESGQNEARSSFNELRRSALNMISTPSDTVSEPWRAEAAKAWLSQQRLLALVIKDSSGEVLYARPGASPYYKRLASGLSFERPEGTTSRLGGPLSSGMAIEALYVTLSQEALFYPIRDAAIAFSAILALLVALLLLVSNASPMATDQSLADDESSRVDASNDTWAPSLPVLDPEESSLYEEDAFGPHGLDKSDADGLASDGTEAKTSTPETKENVPTASFVRSDDLPIGMLDGPRGLFDEETGLGWEAYLRERLSAELRRSASFEQDLSLLIISIDESARGDEEFNLFASTVRDYFSFKDLAFQFGKDGAALILPNMDVDHALRMCEKLQQKLELTLKGMTVDGDNGVFMGLSSRAGRLVDADRIIGEAMAAIGKAKQDGEPSILAFRPDPEKFRAYLAGQ